MISVVTEISGKDSSSTEICYDCADHDFRCKVRVSQRQKLPSKA